MIVLSDGDQSQHSPVSPYVFAYVRVNTGVTDASRVSMDRQLLDMAMTLDDCEVDGREISLVRGSQQQSGT